MSSLCFGYLWDITLGYTELALDDISTDVAAKEHLEQVLKSGTRAKKLVQQILSFSRRSDPEKKLIQIVPVIEETLHLLRATLPATIEIVRDVGPAPGTVLADPTQIHQVLMNLCTNAAHAMRERGGVLNVRLERINLDDNSAAKYPELTPGVYNRLSVTDTGEGMDKDTVERIFEPFFTTKDRGKGTGMGLAVVHGIVRAHGGAISVDSDVGKGSTFHVYLPLPEGEAEEETDGETESLPSGNEHILLVDDEEFLVDICTQTLNHLGYQVTSRTSSLETLDVFKASPDQFHLLITDQTMPNMSGLDLAKAIHSIRPDMPIIICTGFSTHISPEKAKEIGVSRFLMKPLRARDLAEAVREVLDGETFNHTHVHNASGTLRTVR